MSRSLLLNAAASGAAGSDPVYVDDLFSTFLYTGNGTNPHTITNGIDLAGEGGLIWTKARDSASLDNVLVDTERATGWLVSNGTQAASGTSTAYLSFNSDGYDIDNAFNNWNGSTIGDYVSWTFRKQEKFFDIVTWTGNSTGGRTISHNLGSVPGMIIVKRTDTTGAWQVYHRANTANPETDYLVLNTSAGTNDSLSRWNDTAPTSTEFTLGNSATVNYSGGTYVAYLFAHDEQDFGENSDEAIIKCGSYTTDGSGNASIDLGFEPQFIFGKRSSGTGDWFINDTMRGIVTDGNDPYFVPNTSAAENSSYDFYDLTPTGFNHEGGFTSSTYIYVAIRRPHKPASEFAATDLFDQQYGTVTTPVVTTGFPVDFFIERNPNGTDGNYFFNRLTGKKYLQSNSTNTEGTGSLSRFFDFNDGVMSSFGGATAYLIYSFRRAPGFFDVVAYKGSSSAQEISHNLGVAPELIIQKCRTQGSYPWNSWYAGLTNSQYVNLNTNAQISTSSNLWGTNATVATDSVFRTGSGNTGVDGGTSDTHIAYLFASAEGISKIGTFTRTSGDTTNVDCGFTNGARFVVFKRVSGGTGNWAVYDTVRGIVAGNDPYFFLNSNSSQVTNTDYIDPYSAGFTVASGIATGTFLFLAIA